MRCSMDNQRKSNFKWISLKKHPNSSINEDFIQKNSKIALNMLHTKLSVKDNHKESNSGLITLKKHLNMSIYEDFIPKNLKIA